MLDEGATIRVFNYRVACMLHPHRDLEGRTPLNSVVPKGSWAGYDDLFSYTIFVGPQ